MSNLAPVYFWVVAELTGSNDLFNVVDLNPTTGAKKLGQQEIKMSRDIFTASVSTHGDDTVLVNADAKKVTVYDISVPAKLSQVQSFVVGKNPDAWSSSSVRWDVLRSSWVSLGDGVGILAIPLRVTAYSQKYSKGNFDGYILYNISRTGISRQFNISHVASEDYYNCYENKLLTERLMAMNGAIMTAKGHSILSTNLKTGKNLWKLEVANSTVLKCCNIWVNPSVTLECYPRQPNLGL